MSEAPLECRSVLVLGGARSGKSRYALQLAESAGPERLIIATAEALDEEMRDRIARHRAERGPGWSTREAARELAAALREEARRERPIVVDCLTLWLSNLLLSGADVQAHVAELASLTTALAGPVVFVSNEVGGGVTPPYPLGRAFQDWQGRLNQSMAHACDAVVLVTAGLPRLLKPAPTPRLHLR